MEMVLLSGSQGKGLPLLGFDVDGDILERQLGCHEPVLHLMGDRMSFTDGNGTGYPDVEIGDVGESAFTDPAFLGTEDTGYGAGDPVDRFLRIAGDAGIHDLAKGEPEHGVGTVEDDDTGEEGGPVIGDLVSRTADQADGDTDECRDRGDRIGAVMPCIGKEGVAPDTSSTPGHDLKETFLQQDDPDEQEEGPGGGEMNFRSVSGGNELTDAVVGDESPGNREDEGADDGGE